MKSVRRSDRSATAGTKSVKGPRAPRGVAQVALLLCVLALGSVGCRKRADQGTAPAASASTSTPVASSTGPRLVPLPGGTIGVLHGVKPELFHVPVGPRLGIIPGQGLGPVRFGATVPTIERLLEAKCSTLTETECRIMSHAVDFILDKGVVVEMRVHGEERPFTDAPGDTYGIFNGRFLKGATLGMYAQFVQPSVGEPKRIEKFDTPPPGRFQTVERHYYDDMVLEYDRLKNGNVVLAGVILTKPAPGTKPKADVPSAPSAKPAPKK